MKHNLKSLLLFLSFIFSISTFAVDVEQARKLGLEILNTAQSNETSLGKKVEYQVTYAALLSASILMPSEGLDFDRCIANDNLEAYFYSNLDGQIRICRRLNDQTTEFVAQTLIHESAHKAGFTSECDATSIEVGAMRLSAYTPYKNDYWPGCGLD